MVFLKILAGVFFLPWGFLAVAISASMFSREFKDRPYKPMFVFVAFLFWATFGLGAYSLFVDWGAIKYALLELLFQTIVVGIFIVLYTKRFPSGPPRSRVTTPRSKKQDTDYSAVLKLATRAMALSMAFRRKLGRSKIGGATGLGNLAKLLKGANQHVAAEPLYREALATVRGKMGNSHPETASALENLADVLGTIGKTKEAESLYREALTIRQAVQGSNDPDTLLSLNKLMILIGNQRP